MLPPTCRQDDRELLGYFDPGNAAVVLFQFGTRVGLGHMVRSAPAGQTEPILGKRIPSDVIVFH